MIAKKDPKYLGIPNINFSTTDKDSAREHEFAKQRIERGFDESETWSLDYTIASFIIPRIKEFWDIYQKHISSESEEEIEFKNAMPKIIRALELIIKDDGCLIWNREEEEEYFEGIDLFAKYLLWMWW